MPVQPSTSTASGCGGGPSCSRQPIIAGAGGRNHPSCGSPAPSTAMNPPCARRPGVRPAGSQAGTGSPSSRGAGGGGFGGVPVFAGRTWISSSRSPARKAHGRVAVVRAGLGRPGGEQLGRPPQARPVALDEVRREVTGPVALVRLVQLPQLLVHGRAAYAGVPSSTYAPPVHHQPRRGGGPPGGRSPARAPRARHGAGPAGGGAPFAVPAAGGDPAAH